MPPTIRMRAPGISSDSLHYPDLRFGILLLLFSHRGLPLDPGTFPPYTATAGIEILIHHPSAGHWGNAVALPSKNLLKAVFLLLCLTLSLGCSIASAEGKELPKAKKIILWAWERPEDLSCLDPGRAEIAFLAATIRIQNGRLKFLPRRQLLKLPAQTRRIAVIRIETDRKSEPGPFREEAAEIIGHVAEAVHADRLQIDFDARVSERRFYRELLFAIREKLPESVPLSITALASWCMYDRWLAGLPVDEAVPMVFRMGPEGPMILRRLEVDGRFAEPMCRASIGISTDEPVGRLSKGKRVYVFSPTGWSAEKLSDVYREVEKWQ